MAAKAGAPQAIPLKANRLVSSTANEASGKVPTSKNSDSGQEDSETTSPASNVAVAAPAEARLTTTEPKATGINLSSPRMTFSPAESLDSNVTLVSGVDHSSSVPANRSAGNNKGVSISTAKVVSSVRNNVSRLKKFSSIILFKKLYFLQNW